MTNLFLFCAKHSTHAGGCKCASGLKLFCWNKLVQHTTWELQWVLPWKAGNAGSKIQHSLKEKWQWVTYMSPFIKKDTSKGRVATRVIFWIWWFGCWIYRLVSTPLQGTTMLASHTVFWCFRRERLQFHCSLTLRYLWLWLSKYLTIISLVCSCNSSKWYLY